MTVGSRRFDRLLGRREVAPNSEHLLRLLLDGVTDYAIYMLSPEGVVTSWNAGAERIKGYRADEIIGQTFALFFTPEDRCEGAPERILELARTQGRFEAECVRVRKDGSQFNAHVVLNALHGPRGEVIGFAKITRDITERVEARQNLQRVERQLVQAQKMEALGQLTGGMAHDFNNMLAVVTCSFQLCQRALEKGEYDKARNVIGSGLDGAKRAAELITRLLAFARQQPLAPRALDANGLVRNMSEILRRTLGEQVELETVLAGGLWTLNADQSQLESALVNLATNARDAMADGGKLTIETANAHLDDRYAAQHVDVPSGQYVLIAVTDTGVGMSAEEVAKAFEPFYTTKAAGHGTGLGLAQVYGYAKQSGGHVRIYSEPGRGTTVKLYLPRFVGRVEPDPPKRNDAAPRGDAHQTILLVEDEVRVRELTSAALRELGYSVLEAGSAETALALIDAREDIVLLFTDVVMPNMDGRRLADEALRRRPDLSVLYMTGFTRNAIIHRGMLDPGTHFIAKPFTLDDLAWKLREAISS